MWSIFSIIKNNVSLVAYTLQLLSYKVCTDTTFACPLSPFLPPYSTCFKRVRKIKIKRFSFHSQWNSQVLSMFPYSCPSVCLSVCFSLCDSKSFSNTLGRLSGTLVLYSTTLPGTPHVVNRQSATRFRVRVSFCLANSRPKCECECVCVGVPRTHMILFSVLCISRPENVPEYLTSCNWLWLLCLLLSSRQPHRIHKFTIRLYGNMRKREGRGWFWKTITRLVCLPFHLSICLAFFRSSRASKTAWSIFFELAKVGKKRLQF